MDFRGSKLVINLILMLMIVFFIIITLFVFISGPARAYEKEDLLYVEAILKQTDYKQGQLLNRFSSDQVYYLIQVDNKSSIIVSNKDFTVLKEFSFYEKELVYELASSLNVEKDKISYGYYDNDLVFVLDGTEFETYVRASDLQIVYHLGREF